MIVQALCTSFKKQILEGAHDFRLTDGDVFKIALYSSAATLGEATTEYSATDEIAGTGYTAGGATLTNVSPSSSSTTAFLDFADVVWAASTLTARGALIYNTTPGHTYSNAAVAVLDFGSDKSSSASNFTISFPSPDITNAIIRIA